MPPYEIPEILKIVILAVVQGITEFLPISSSGHLVVTNALFGTHPDQVLGMGIVMHFGTLIAILVFYRKEIVALLGEDRRVTVLIVFGSIPAAGFGFYIKYSMDWLTVSPLLAGFLLPVTGFILMLLPALDRRRGDDSEKLDSNEQGIRYQDMGIGRAMLIGLAQAVAILPGISRSGMTIVAGVALGLNRKSAATFSFLLAIPAIGGATLLEGIDLIRDPEALKTSVGVLGLGMLLSAVVGWVSLALLVRWLSRRQLHWFAYWVIPLGFLVIVWQLYVFIAENSGI